MDTCVVHGTVNFSKGKKKTKEKFRIFNQSVMEKGACFNVRTGDIEEYPCSDALQSFPVRQEADGDLIVCTTRAQLKAARFDLFFQYAIIAFARSMCFRPLSVVCQLLLK